MKRSIIFMAWITFMMTAAMVWTNTVQAETIRLTPAPETDYNYACLYSDENGNVLCRLYNFDDSGILPGYKLSFFDGQKLNEIYSTKDEFLGQSIEVGNGHAYWFTYNSQGGCKLKHFNGTQVQDIATYNKASFWGDIPRTAYDKGLFAWTIKTDSQKKLYLYDGQKVNELESSSGNDDIILRLNSGEVAWTIIDEAGKVYKVKYYNGQQTKELGPIGNRYSICLNNSKLAWIDRDESNGFKLVYYDGQKVTQLGSVTEFTRLTFYSGKLYWEYEKKLYVYDGQNVQPIIAPFATYGGYQIENGKIAWIGPTSSNDYQLYLYDGQKVNEIGSTKDGSFLLIGGMNELFPEYTFRDGKLAWIQRNDAEKHTLHYFDGQSARLITSSTGMALVGLDNGKIVWTQNQEEKNKLCLYDGKQVVTVADYGNVEPYCVDFNNGRIVYSTPDKDLYLYKIEPSLTPDWDLRDEKVTDQLLKDWTITFNKDLDASSVNKDSVYITNSQGTKLPAAITTTARTINIKPDQSYIEDQPYYLYLTTDLQSENKVSLKKGVKMPFRYNK